MSEAGGAIRSIKIVWDLVDRVTAPAKKIDAEVDKMRGHGGEVAKKYQETTTASTDKIAGGYRNALNSVTQYVNTAKTRITSLSDTLEKHQAALLGVGTAAGGIAALSAWGAINEEKYKQNVKSYFDDAEEDAVLQWIDLAKSIDYASKEGRAKFASQMALFGASTQTIMDYGDTVEQLGIGTGYSLKETLTAINSAAGGEYQPLKKYGLEEITASAVTDQINKIRDLNPELTESQLRMEALLSLIDKYGKESISDFDEAIDSTYGSMEILKNQWSDLSGNIGAVYLPALRGVFETLSSVFKLIQSSPILTHAFAWGTLLTITLAFGGLALPKVIAGLRWWKSLTILQTLANWGLVSSEAAATGGIRGLIIGVSAYIPASISAAYATGGLSAALWAIAMNPITWVIMAIVGAIWLLWDTFSQPWEETALCGAINWMFDTFPWLAPLVDGIVVAMTYLRESLAGVWSYLEPIVDSITGALENPYVKLILDAMWAATPMGMAENAWAIATGEDPKLLADIKEISGYSEDAYRQDVVNRAYADANRETTINHITVDASMNTGDLKTEGVTKEDLDSLMNQRDKKVQSGLERMIKGELSSAGAGL